jgi:hypothetical protein
MPWEREIESRALIYRSFGANHPSMPIDNALDGRQPDPGALKVFRAVQALKHTEQLVDILHLKACAVVGDEYLHLISFSVNGANLYLRPRSYPCEFDRI